MDYDVGIVRRRRIISPDECYFAVPPPSGLFVPCAGTPGFHSIKPNDLTPGGGSWNSAGLTVTFGSPDPVGGSTATDLVSTNNGISQGTTAESVVTEEFTLTSGVTYSFGAYFKWIAGPVWILVQATDSIANAFGSWFNISVPAVGSSSNAGTGTLTCALAAAAGNGYTQVSFAGNLSSTNTVMRFEIFLVDGNGTLLSTLNQEFLAWQVCP